MAKLIVSFLLLLSFHYLLLTSHVDADANADFIKAECRATHYPSLCVQCFANYTPAIRQSQFQLAQAALSVSLSRVQSAADFVTKLAKMRALKPTVYRAVQDCMQNLGGSVDQLSRSLKELGGMEQRRPGVAGQDFSWHVGNAQTWVSSALTYENMCLEGFGSADTDGTVKVAIRKRVVVSARVTSNALALVNRFAARHNNAKMP